VLNSTLHCVVHDRKEGADYAAVVELLLASGANVDVVDPTPTGNARVDEVIQLSSRAKRGI